MNFTSNHEMIDMLQQAVQLNPFDAVIIVQSDVLNDQVVAANKQALELFYQQDEQMLADHFFSNEDWQNIKKLALTQQSNFFQIKMNKVGSSYIHSSTLYLEQQKYFKIVIRKELSNFEPFSKHSKFIEHYKDAIVVVNTKSEVLYINHAASNKLKQPIHQVLQQSFSKWLQQAYKGQLQILLQSILDGRPTVIPNCKMNSLFYLDEDVSIQAFPTYWDGEIIGAHIILKRINLFLMEQTAFQQIAYQDELTGLLNRRALHEQWEPYENKQSKQQLALLLIDIDRFKRFNESLGKQKTDELLRKISKRLAEIQTYQCELFHYNGDEFVVILQDGDAKRIECVANRIIKMLEQPFVMEEQEYFITVSIGISHIERGEKLDLKLLLHHANQALHYVKKHGRGQYQLYLDSMKQELMNEVLMEAHLRRAIEFNELFLHFQPQFNLITNEIDSLEALARWNNRKFGQVSPGQFIPLAESTGLIIQLGNWILEKACQYVQQWREKGYRSIRVAVNISPKQFKHVHFVQNVRELLEKYEIDPQYIELEITEGSLMNVHESTSILEELKEIGVYVSIDDFGTGYSSLSYLKKYPIDIIKIDQSFIADIEKDEKNEKIIKAIILLSHTLGLEVIAEGVEKQSQEQFLRQHQCEKVQGYLYDKPISAYEIEKQYLKLM